MSKIIIHRPYHWYDRKFGYQVFINQQPVANLCNKEKQEVLLAAPGIIEAKIMWCGSTVVSIDPAKEENIQLRIRPNTTLHQLLLVTVAVSISCIALANLFPIRMGKVCDNGSTVGHVAAVNRVGNGGPQALDPAGKKKSLAISSTPANGA